MSEDVKQKINEFSKYINKFFKDNNLYGIEGECDD